MTNELTVRVEHPELPAIRWNETEVQQNLTEMLAAYTGRVYTPDTIKDAKADRAAVNKLDKQLSDAARSAKAFYMKPLEEFLQSAKQMQGQCKAVSGAIDQQVKAVEEAERQDKQDALRAVYADCIGELRELIPFDRLLVPQWLNKTYDLAKASRELRRDVETRRKELKIIQDTCGEDAEACKLGYLRVLDLNAALAEHLRLQDNREKLRRAEAERQAAERARAAAPVIIPPTEEERQLKAEAEQSAQSNAFITASGRLDCAGAAALCSTCTAGTPCPQAVSFLGGVHPRGYRMVQAGSRRARFPLWFYQIILEVFTYGTYSFRRTRAYFVRFQCTGSGKPFRPERQPCRQHCYAGRIPVRSGGDHCCRWPAPRRQF